MRRAVLLTLTLAVLSISCATEPPPEYPEPARFDAAASAPRFARVLIEAARDDRLAAHRDHDGQLALTYVLYKHAAVALSRQPGTSAVGAPMLDLGRSMAICAMLHAFIHLPATECFDHAAEMPVPPEIAPLLDAPSDAGEPVAPLTLGEVAQPLVEANEAREEARRARLAALDPARCELRGFTSFGGREHGSTRAAIERAFGISFSATTWLTGVEQFHYAILDCGDGALALLLSEYREGFGPSGTGTAIRRERLFYLSWQIEDAADTSADAVHEGLRREGGVGRDPRGT
ncbi:MAG: hypothetical protein EVA89_28215 [Sandaracinaceae bacterium]|nr:MAG: hypothetical protein EVA89_28215 [Sandaracinaceae bacterium]